MCSDKNSLIEAIIMSTHYTIFNNKKTILIHPKSAFMDFFQKDSRTS